jgi:5-methyltetrahydrofolate--homocysteine methyltransferase
MARFDFDAGFARLQAAMAGGGAAEVPIIAQMHEFAMKTSGVPGHVFYSDARAFVEGTCATARGYGFDTPSFIWDVYNVEAEALGVKLVLFEDMAPALDNTKPFIASEKDLAALRSPDPARAGRMPMVAEILHLAEDLTGQRPSLGFCAPFTMAAHLMTFEQLIVQIRRNPAFVHKVMDFIVEEVLVPYFEYMQKQFPDLPAFDGSDATASLPFITREMQEEFALGPILRLQEKVSIPTNVDNWWGDSFTDDHEDFWRAKLQATPGYLKIQDPDLWKVGVAGPMAFARAQDKPVVLGIDNNLFQNGPEEEIRRRVHEYMEAIEESGGRGTVYFCSLSAVTPPENVAIAVDAVRRFRAGERPWAGERRAGCAAVPEGGAGSREALSLSEAVVPEDEEEASPEEARLDDIYFSVIDQEDDRTAGLVRQALDEGLAVTRVLDDGLIAAMDEVGGLFSDGKIFVPEMLMSARAMKAGLGVLRPLLTSTGAPPRGRVMLATVQGDVHDIGKNLVGMMLEGAGYEVVDLGVNVAADEVLEQAEALRPDLVGLSALLTTSMPAMQKTVRLFKDRAAPFPVIVGGAPVTRDFAEKIGADGYGGDAPEAVETVHRLVRPQRERSAAAA